MSESVRKAVAVAIVLLAGGGGLPAAETAAWQQMALPVKEGRWLRPAADGPAVPAWGHADGLRVGLWPAPGPRGLLRIYAPYLGHPDGRMINYIAVEPIVEGKTARGLSELEKSSLDGLPGKRFWSADAPADPTPRLPERPSRGEVATEGGVEILRVWILVEPFENGTQPCLRLTFRADRPYEAGLAAFAQPKSRPMSACILTATMGNYARLRRLYLANRIVTAADLWPKFDGKDFAPHARFDLADLFRTREGYALVAATTDEKQPDRAEYAPNTGPGWKYQGAPATQYWRCETPVPRLAVQVNGRSVYWASRTPIPGGVAFENFEMVAPFREGQEFWFGVTTRTPQELGLPAK